MKIVLLSLIGVIGAVVILGFLLPKDFSIEREMIINKPKDVVFDYVKSLKNDNSWNPWAVKDSTIVFQYKGTDGTVGCISSWSGRSGVGEQEITSIVEGQKMTYELRFKKPFEATNQSYLMTESVGNQTKIKWGMTGTVPFPMNILHQLSKGMLVRAFDEGLGMLKTDLEKK